MAQGDPPIKPGQPNVPAPQVPGRPFVYQFPTPLDSDRILSVLKDSRMGGFKLPDPKAPYDGPEAERFSDFMFATAKPVEQSPGWWTLYYTNERANSDSFNYVIDFPYVDHDYPRYTRSYVLLRSNFVEPNADDLDPVFNPTVTPAGPTLLLVDHKITRSDDPIIDALFVGVTRVYERLPGPIIVSYMQNELKQVVKVETQDVEINATPPISDELMEALKIERKDTAKATVILSHVPDIFPKHDLTTNWGSAFRDPLPLEFRSAVPLHTAGQIVSMRPPPDGQGPPAQPVLLHGDLTATETQVTEFTKLVLRTHFDVIHVELTDQRLTAEGQTATITKILDPSVQTVQEDDISVPLETIGGDVQNLGGDVGTIKKVETVPEVFTHFENEVSIPQRLPPEFETLLPTVQQSIHTKGLVTNPIVLAPGIFRQKEVQKSKTIKIIDISKRDLTQLPKTLIDKKLTEEYGGGILDIIKIAEVGVLGPEEGYDVVSSRVINLGETIVGDPTSALRVRETERVEGGIWPTLYGIHTEEAGIYAGIVTGYDKTVVPLVPLIPPHPQFVQGNPGLTLPTPGTYVEITPIDKWRSIQIATRIDLRTLPPPKTRVSTVHLSLPAVLDAVVANWTITQGSSGAADDGFRRTAASLYPAPTDGGKAEVTVSGGAMGSIAVLHHGGHNGPALAYITTIFLDHPPTVAEILAASPGAIRLIRPSSGTATLVGKHAVANAALGKDFGSSGLSSELRHEVVNLGPFLTNSINNEISTFPISGLFNSPHETSGAFSVGPLSLLSAPCTMRVDINASIPNTIVKDQLVFMEAPVIVWRFGLYVLEVIQAIVP